MTLTDQTLRTSVTPSTGGVAGDASVGIARADAEPSDRPAAALRSVDSQLLQALSDLGATGIGPLIDRLGVTATAIRQRIERMLEAGLIEREKVVSGRGRPAFLYRLTDRGQWCAGADPSDLAEAMWHEILELEDQALRSRLLGGVAKRIGRRFAERLDVERLADQSSLDSRMRRLVEMLAQRRIATRIPSSGADAPSLPVLDVPACPYPTLRDATVDRSMCQLETEMLSEALGQPIRLSSCLLDGDAVCRFVPAGDGSDESPALR